MLTVRIPIANPEALLTTWGPGALARLESSATEAGAYTEVGTTALLAGLYEYYVVDAAGTSAMWYRWRPSVAAPAAPEDYGTYSDPWVPGGPYLSLDQLRGFVSTSLGDEALLILLDAAMNDIVAYAGPAGTTTEWLHGSGQLLRLSRPVLSIGAIVENDVTLAADDYEVSGSGEVLRRTRTGTHPRHGWGWRVDVTYTPRDDLAARQRAQLQLVQLAMATDPNLASERLGDWAVTYQSSPKTVAEQRDDILASLDPAGVGIF